MSVLPRGHHFPPLRDTLHHLSPPSAKFSPFETENRPSTPRSSPRCRTSIEWKTRGLEKRSWHSTPRAIDPGEIVHESCRIREIEARKYLVIKGVGQTFGYVGEIRKDIITRACVQDRRNEDTLAHTPLSHADELSSLNKDLTRPTTRETNDAKGWFALEFAFVDHDVADAIATKRARPPSTDLN